VVERLQGDTHKVRTLDLCDVALTLLPKEVRLQQRATVLAHGHSGPICSDPILSDLIRSDPILSDLIRSYPILSDRSGTSIG
jgi:hypothetical protein